MFRTIRDFFRSQFLAEATLIMKQLRENDPSISEILVVAKHEMPGGISSVFVLKKHEDQNCTFHRNTRNRRTGSVSGPVSTPITIEDFDRILRKMTDKGFFQLKTRLGGIKDGIRYELAYSGINCQKQIQISHPRRGNGYSELVQLVEAEIRGFNANSPHDNP